MDASDKSELSNSLDSVTMGEVQLLLAEKRTSLATLRMGIAIFAFPLSVLSVLIATSRLYKIQEVLHWIIPLLLLNLALIGLGCHLIFRSLQHIRHCDRLIKELKQKYGRLAELLG